MSWSGMFHTRPIAVLRPREPYACDGNGVTASVNQADAPRAGGGAEPTVADRFH